VHNQPGVQIDDHPLGEEVFTPEATAFVADLVRTFRGRRDDLLSARLERQERINHGEFPDFLPETAAVRSGDWKASPEPEPLMDRRVEITGPTDRKMMINALNSGARVFMADCEDATSPTWDNVVSGQINIRDAYRRNITLDQGEKHYQLNDEIATLFVRFRGWHLDERHVMVDGQAAPASLVDFALTFFHGAQKSLDQGAGPFYYLPKLESHLEARLWNDVFNHAQDALNIPRGSIRATVLVETILAAFEMDEIIYELREHSAGLNAGRWDYIFSVAKKFAAHKSFVLPDRNDVSMTAPFMRAYTELLIATCHKRGVHAMGGMAAFIPNRHDPEVTEHAIAKVTQGKALEAADGCDGTWVAHPDLVPVAQAEFDAVLQGAVHQLDRQRPEVSITAAALLSVDQTVGSITEEGLRINIHVGLRYLAGWLNGLGAAAIHNMMEDAATAEICRSQIWQWIQHGCSLDDGRLVTPALVREFAEQEMVSIEETLGAEMFAQWPFGQAKQVFEDLALTDEFIEFLTLPLYELLD